MTYEALKQKFPNASASFLLANASDGNPFARRAPPAPVVERPARNGPLENESLNIEKLYECYLRAGSVHRAAIEFKTTGETVRRRLLNAGKRLLRNKWSQQDIDTLKVAYAETGDFDLPALAKQIGRTYAAVACKAEDLGLCCERGKQTRTPAARANGSRAQIEVSKRPEVKAARIRALKEYFARSGHPRGMLGKHHTQQAKQKISDGLAGCSVPRERVIRQFQTRLKRYGSIAPATKRGSWRAAWREIGGKRKFFRSRWEANYARYLEWLKQNGQIQEWLHEPETFWFTKEKRGVMSYLPDFKVIAPNGSWELREVKGWMDARSKTKIARMAQYYPSVRLTVIRGDWFKANNRKLAGLIKGWE